jgi:ring-1,2-phenylacetyl-CoA epoxidase subunit PaaD
MVTEVLPDVAVLRAAAEAVPDPEMPMLTLADLGVLRDVSVDAEGTVHATITPTYSGCPAIEMMRGDVAGALLDAGAPRAVVGVVLAPAWSTDDISAEGRRKLAEHGIAPPGESRRTSDGPVSLSLSVRCPRCGSPATRETSRFGPTPCTALWTCTECLEPFEHVKAL